MLAISLVLATSLFFSAHLTLGAGKNQPGYSKNTDLEKLDPMERIGKGYIKKKENANDLKLCDNSVVLNSESAKKDSENDNLKNLVAGYPIAEMVSDINAKDKTVAAFLVGIAKKESDWGKHSPQKDGRDCHNYWGYKGSYNLTASGYSCFDSASQAVAIVGGRIEDLVGQKINTPERMVVWKCGSSCAGFPKGDVVKWIGDVGRYFYQLNS
jgi:hypothetical protein